MLAMREGEAAEARERCGEVDSDDDDDGQSEDVADSIDFVVRVSILATAPQPTAPQPTALVASTPVSTHRHKPASRPTHAIVTLQPAVGPSASSRSSALPTSPHSSSSSASSARSTASSRSLFTPSRTTSSTSLSGRVETRPFPAHLTAMVKNATDAKKSYRCSAIVASAAAANQRSATDSTTYSAMLSKPEIILALRTAVAAKAAKAVNTPQK